MSDEVTPATGTPDAPIPAHLQAFDPTPYVTALSGSPYLEVKWRLLWYRSVFPEGALNTEMVSHDGQLAVFKATVTDGGAASATGWGSEQYSDFRDYIEKAETKAVGRALAALGFGTQFTGATAETVADAPAGRGNSQRSGNQGSSGYSNTPIPGKFLGVESVLAGPPLSDRQVKMIEAKIGYAGVSPDELQHWFSSGSGSDRQWETMNKKAASNLIDTLVKAEADGVKGLDILPPTGSEPQAAAPAAPAKPADIKTAITRSLQLDQPLEKQEQTFAWRIKQAKESGGDSWIKLVKGVLWTFGPDAPQGAGAPWRIISLLQNAPTMDLLYETATMIGEAPGGLYTGAAGDAYDQRMQVLQGAPPSELDYPADDTPY